MYLTVVTMAASTMHLLSSTALCSVHLQVHIDQQTTALHLPRLQNVLPWLGFSAHSCQDIYYSHQFPSDVAVRIRLMSVLCFVLNLPAQASSVEKLSVAYSRKLTSIESRYDAYEWLMQRSLCDEHPIESLSSKKPLTSL